MNKWPNVQSPHRIIKKPLSNTFLTAHPPFSCFFHIRNRLCVTPEIFQKDTINKNASFWALFNGFSMRDRRFTFLFYKFPLMETMLQINKKHRRKGHRLNPTTNARLEQQKPGSATRNRRQFWLKMREFLRSVHQQEGSNSLKRWWVGVYIFCRCECEVGAACKRMNNGQEHCSVLRVQFSMNQKQLSWLIFHTLPSARK